MFYNKYLDYDSYYELLDNYDNFYLSNIDCDNFDKIYNLFKKYKFNYLEDIILRYIEIFTLDYEYVEDKLKKLVKALGINYVDIIGDNLEYLEYFLR